MRSFSILLVTTSLLIGCQNNEQTIPYGNEVELNNLLSENEWTDSKIHPLNDSLRLRLHQDSQYLYFAVDFNEVNLDQYR